MIYEWFGTLSFISRRPVVDGGIRFSFVANPLPGILNNLTKRFTPFQPPKDQKNPVKRGYTCFEAISPDSWWWKFTFPVHSQTGFTTIYWQSTYYKQWRVMHKKQITDEKEVWGFTHNRLFHRDAFLHRAASCHNSFMHKLPFDSCRDTLLLYSAS